MIKTAGLHQGQGTYVLTAATESARTGKANAAVKKTANKYDDNMKNKLMFSVISVLLFFILANFVFAAPLPWGIAIKSDTKECVGYWGGDEYVGYKLPSGWKAYYSNDDEVITTEFGSCEFRKWAGDPPGAEEKCCKELGLTFVSVNIGESHGIWQLFYPPTIFWTISALIAIVLVIAFFIALFFVIKHILRKLRKV